MRRLAIALTVGAVSFASAVPARADDAARAAELNREAAEHAKHEEWNVARALLAEAYRLRPDASLLVNLAASELKSDHGVDALRHLRAYLADPHGDPNVKQAIQNELLPRAMAATAHLTIHFPAGARVTVDNETLSTDASATAATDDVIPGAHSVDVWSAGATTHKGVQVKAGESMDVRATPEASPTPAAAAPPPPVAEAPVDHADHDRLQSGWTTGRFVSLGLLVGGAALAGVGTYFALDASSKLHQADGLVSNQLGGSTSACSSGAAPSACQTTADLHSTYDQDIGLATGFFVAGGALAVVTFFAWPRPSRGEQGLLVRPYVAPGGGGLVGRF